MGQILFKHKISVLKIARPKYFPSCLYKGFHVYLEK